MAAVRDLEYDDGRVAWPRLMLDEEQFQAVDRRSCQPWTAAAIVVHSLDRQAQHVSVKRLGTSDVVDMVRHPAGSWRTWIYSSNQAQSARSCDFGQVEEQAGNVRCYQALRLPPISRISVSMEHLKLSAILNIPIWR